MSKALLANAIKAVQDGQSIASAAKL